MSNKKMGKKIKKNLVLAFLLVFSFSIFAGTFSVNEASASITANPDVPGDDVVNSMTLTGDGEEVKWEVGGRSSKGFKLVWSKNPNPTYPTRSGDKYHYHSSPEKRGDKLTAFAGDGVYYARVCEYLGGKCGRYSNEIKVQLGNNADVKPVLINEPVVINEATKVESITLTGEKNTVKWEVEGRSPKGFKVVWSMNEGPTYPTREGDKYHYRANPIAVRDFITPFAGNGTYYVRVCEYLGRECGVYSNEIKVEIANAGERSVVEIKEIRDSASNLFNNKLDSLLAEVKMLRNRVREQEIKLGHLMRLKSGLKKNITEAVENAINNFITYGVDDNTKKLGEGERAAVMYSFKKAYDKLPETEDELEDAIKIANGRWPSLMNSGAEDRAKAQFKKIYLRASDMNNDHDASAVKVMAYGLRQRAENRNLNSEKAGIKIFKGIFKKLPETTEEWNTLQAITYSGAKR